LSYPIVNYYAATGAGKRFPQETLSGRAAARKEMGRCPFTSARYRSIAASTNDASPQT
jgi:hypothetical protein